MAFFAVLQNIFEILHNEDVGGDWTFAGDGTETGPAVRVLKTDLGHRAAREERFRSRELGLL